MEPVLNPGIVSFGNAETIDVCEETSKSEMNASCDVSVTRILAANPLRETGESSQVRIKEAGSVESWLLLPIPAGSMQDQLDDASIESNSKSSCRPWMELPSCIDEYISAEVTACCKRGISVSYQKDGLGSAFIPLFQM